MKVIDYILGGFIILGYIVFICWISIFIYIYPSMFKYENNNDGVMWKEGKWECYWVSKVGNHEMFCRKIGRKDK